MDTSSLLWLQIESGGSRRKAAASSAAAAEPKSDLDLLKKSIDPGKKPRLDPEEIDLEFLQSREAGSRLTDRQAKIRERILRLDRKLQSYTKEQAILERKSRSVEMDLSEGQSARLGKLRENIEQASTELEEALESIRASVRAARDGVHLPRKRKKHQRPEDSDEDDDYFDRTKSARKIAKTRGPKSGRRASRPQAPAVVAEQEDRNASPFLIELRAKLQDPGLTSEAVTEMLQRILNRRDALQSELADLKQTSAAAGNGSEEEEDTLSEYLADVKVDMGRERREKVKSELRQLQALYVELEPKKQELRNLELAKQFREGDHEVYEREEAKRRKLAEEKRKRIREKASQHARAIEARPPPAPLFEDERSRSPEKAERPLDGEMGLGEALQRVREARSKRQQEREIQAQKEREAAEQAKRSEEAAKQALRDRLLRARQERLEALSGKKIETMESPSPPPEPKPVASASGDRPQQGPAAPPTFHPPPEPDPLLMDDTDESSWIPPAGQTGDGRTHLNEKWGY